MTIQEKLTEATANELQLSDINERIYEIVTGELSRTFETLVTTLSDELGEEFTARVPEKLIPLLDSVDDTYSKFFQEWYKIAKTNPEKYNIED